MPTTLILGASRGIGLELARQSLAAGERVIATARSDAGLQALRALGAQALRLDVAEPASVSGLAWQLDGEQIDSAWYVAGVMCARADARQPPTAPAFDRVMHTNVLGAMQVIPQVAPLVEAAGGRFGFISSTMGRIGDVEASNAWLYRVSKAALNMVVASARHSYPRAVLAAFHPGWVQTDMGGEAAPLTVADSVRGMRAVLAQVTPADRARLLHHDGRRATHW